MELTVEAAPGIAPGSEGVLRTDSRTGEMRDKRMRSGHCSAGYDPLHRLAGDLRDQLVITVVVQDDDTFSFGHRRDQQIGQADRPDAPVPPQGALDVKRAPPVFIMGR